jgi:hypothetical protein
MRLSYTPSPVPGTSGINWRCQFIFGYRNLRVPRMHETTAEITLNQAVLIHVRGEHRVVLTTDRNCQAELGIAIKDPRGPCQGH